MNITKKTHRLMTLHELVLSYPKSFFNGLGELIYDSGENKYIISGQLCHLGKYVTGFRNELYVLKSKKVDGYNFKE